MLDPTQGMDEMTSDAPPDGRSTPDVRRRLRIATWAVVLLALVAIYVVTSAPEADDGRADTLVVEDGLMWGNVDVLDGSDGDGATVTASVALDDGAFPVADSRDDRFVLFQLGDGRFDVDAHVDDSVAERVIGLDDDDTVQLFSSSLADGATLPAGSGEYAMSLDGRIEYRDIPSGTWELRALVVTRDGAWDGEQASRTVVVP